MDEEEDENDICVVSSFLKVGVGAKKALWALWMIMGGGPTGLRRSWEGANNGWPCAWCGTGGAGARRGASGTGERRCGG
jgi:hypothetical protein